VTAAAASLPLQSAVRAGQGRHCLLVVRLRSQQCFLDHGAIPERTTLKAQAAALEVCSWVTCMCRSSGAKDWAALSYVHRRAGGRGRLLDCGSFCVSRPMPSARAASAFFRPPSSECSTECCLACQYHHAVVFEFHDLISHVLLPLPWCLSSRLSFINAMHKLRNLQSRMAFCVGPSNKASQCAGVTSPTLR
jgi:hypothetical protein